MHFLVIGGSDAGISAGLRAREMDPNCEVSLLLADSYPNYSICGLPFFLSGETRDWRSLAHRTEFPGIQIFRDHTAENIDPIGRSVRARTLAGKLSDFRYDKLLISTGARPVRPRIEGIDLPGVFPLHTMSDSFAVHQFLQKQKPKTAIIVGAGYIGLEMADAFVHRGIEVCLVGRTETVLPTVDTRLGALVEAELRRHGVEVRNELEVTSIKPGGRQLKVYGTQGFSGEADLVLIAAGVAPNSELGAAAGVKTGAKDALCVNRRMETNLPDVFAAGDCVETWHRILNRNVYIPLGSTAHKQGRIAGENVVGGTREFEGSLGTQVVKVFDLVIARSGLLNEEARKADFDPLTTETTEWDHKSYYPGAHELHIIITGDRSTGRLLGAQILGHVDSEVSKRIDVLASTLHHRMKVEELTDLDLSYTPPLSSPWDPIQMAAQKWSLTRLRL